MNIKNFYRANCPVFLILFCFYRKALVYYFSKPKKERDDVMKLLIQIGIVFGVCWVGEIIASMLPFTFPSSVISMILLLLLLLSKYLKTDHIREKSDFLLHNMAFFFVPSGVAIMDKLELLQGSILKIVAICFITLVITFLVTAYTVTTVMKLQNRKGA